MKSGRSGPLRKIIEEILVPLGQGGRLVEAGLALAWPRIVGPEVAGHTFPWHLKGGVLTVGVSGSAWLNQLHFFRDDIARKVNAHLGETCVHTVRLALRGKTAPPAPPRDLPRTRDLAPEEVAEIEAACRVIADAELRETVRRFLVARAARADSGPGDAKGRRG